ncbi:MAG: molybdopterin-guanine dinucleotide biosynthesis protein B [Chloroflexota bacterium]|nr:molybdopterin-guanine dinucleotide biosynthesis protein B [Chloroflexota bacterium]
MSIPCLGVIGRSNSGKTTLLEKLIGELTRRGYRVAVLKHTRHPGVQTDLPGKDTRRLWEAGAVHTTFLTPDRLVQTQRYAEEPQLARVLAGIRDVDLILIEGYKRSAFPKIEVVRAARDPHPLPGIAGRIAYVTDLPALAGDLPLFELNAIEPLVAFVENYLAEWNDGTLAGD